MDNFKNLAGIRRDYGALSLNEEVVLDDPIAQFESWFAEVLEKERHDPTAMVLSTV
ncbi:MAG: pyridoxamine 5'-phosphate oxidase, partial [Legionella sp.]